MQTAISKEGFLGADDLPLVKVPLPEEHYGKDACLYVRTMTGSERSAMEKEWTSKDWRQDPGGFRWAVLVKTVVDERGNAFFAPKDRAAVMAKNAGVIETLFEEACAQNGLTKKDVEELEKN